MKTPTLLTGSFLATFFLANFGQAADITWQAPQAISSALDVNTQGTLFTAKSTGYGYTVNGVFFNPAAANFSEDFTRGDVGYMGGQTFIGTNNADGQAYAGLMDIAHAFNGWGNATATITFSDLTVGQQYLVQYWVADYRNFPNDRFLTLTGGANTSGQLKFLDSDNSNGGIHGSYVIGTFTADATSQAININSNECTMMQAVQLRTNLALADANGIWTGADGNWGDATKWDANTIAHGIDKSATFAGLTPVTVTVDTGHPIGALNFSGANHTIAADAGSLNLNIDTVFTSPTVTVADGITATIGAQLTGNEGLTKAGTGTLLLSGTRNYTGTTDVTEGRLQYQGGTYASSLHNIASGAVLDFNVPSGTYDGASTTFTGAGTLRKTAAGTLWWPATIATFSLDSGALIDVQGGTFTGGAFANESWAGNLSDLNVAASATFNTVEANVRVNKITGSGTIATGFSGAGYQNLTIGVDNGTSTFDGVITDSSAPGNLLKIGTGTITLTGASTYTGTTIVDAGTLSLAQAFLNDDAAVDIGFDGTLHLGFSGTDVVGSLKIDGTELPPGVYNSSHPSYGSHFTGTGSLEVLGVNGTWTSLVNGDWGNAANWSGNNVASGIDSIATFSATTGVTVNLDSNRPIGGLVFGTTGYTLAGSSTLTLNTTSNVSTISVGSGLAATISAKLASVDEVTKAGTGTLTLSTPNDFSNAINVSQGTLELATDWTFGNAGTGTAIVPGLVTVESGATLRAVNSLANQLNGLTLNGGTVEAVGVGNADWGNFHLTGNVTATGTSNLNGDIALRASNVDFFTDTGATLNVGGVMHNGAFFGIYSGVPASVSKSGDGTMVLSAANTYTGSTTVDGGTLVLADNAQLKFVVTDAPAANMVTGTGTATFNGDFNIDTSGVAGSNGGIWLLVDRASLNGESFGSTFSVIGFTDSNDDGIWLMTDPKGNWSFDEASGELTLDVGSDYDDWVTANGVIGGETDDDDSDGLTNFEEYAFGLDPTGGSSVNAISIPLDKSTGKFRYTRRATPAVTGLAYTVWTSTDLSTWSEDAGATASQTVTGTAGEVETVEATITGALPLTQPKLFIQVRAQ